MAQIDAVFRHGVFEPLAPVDLPDNQRVRLTVEAAPKRNAADWFRELQEVQAKLKAKYGTFPDSAPEIAKDRLR